MFNYIELINKYSNQIHASSKPLKEIPRFRAGMN